MVEEVAYGRRELEERADTGRLLGVLQLRSRATWGHDCPALVVL